MTDTTLTGTTDEAAKEEAARRPARIAALREFLDWLEANPAVPIPSSLTYFGVHTDMAEARIIRGHAHGWQKVSLGEWFSYELRFGGEITFNIWVAKTEATCQRVQIGVKHVEAVEAHDEPVYEWVCDPAADDTPEGTA